MEAAPTEALFELFLGFPLILKWYNHKSKIINLSIYLYSMTVIVLAQTKLSKAEN